LNVKHISKEKFIGDVVDINQLSYYLILNGISKKRSKGERQKDKGKRGAFGSWRLEVGGEGRRARDDG